MGEEHTGDKGPPRGGAGAEKPSRITCEFCECVLARDGFVLRRSARAKTLKALEEAKEKDGDELKTLRARVAELEADVSRVNGELEKALDAKKIRW